MKKGSKHSKEARNKISSRRLGKHFSKLSAALMGHTVSEKTREKIRLIKLGKKASSETRKKMSKNNAQVWLGKHRSDEARKKMRLAKLGKKLSKEHKKKIGLAGIGRIVSDETRKKMRQAKLGKYRGNKSSNWQGGITPLNEKIRHSTEYKLWRTSIFERDNFTCQKCKKSGGYLIGHHINNFAEKIELQLAIDNGCTLCKRCHLDFHNKYSRKNNTREQLNEFLNNN